MHPDRGWEQPRAAWASDAYPWPAAYVSLRRRMRTSTFPAPADGGHTARVHALTSAIFVGRATELQRLKHALDTTRAGNGTTALVTGDAGIGKSRLTSQLATHARQTGFDVLT